MKKNFVVTQPIYIDQRPVEPGTPVSLTERQYRYLLHALEEVKPEAAPAPATAAEPTAEPSAAPVETAPVKTRTEKARA